MRRTDVPALATFTVAQRALCDCVKVPLEIIVPSWPREHCTLSSIVPSWPQLYPQLIVNNCTLVNTHSRLGAQPQSDRILRLLCGGLAPAALYMFSLDALKRACRSSSLQASRSARSVLKRI